MIKKLRAIFTRRDKQFLLLLFGFSIFISLLETVGISVIMPFISVATDFSIVESSRYYRYVYDLFSFTSPQNFVIFFGVFLIFFYIFRSMLNLWYIYMLSRFSQGRYALLAYRLFENYMGYSYKDFVKKNSSVLSKAIINEAYNLTLLVQNVLFMMSEFFVIILLYGLMLYVNYKITLLITLILFINGVFLTQTVSKRIKKSGSLKADLQGKFYEIIHKSFGNFKLIKLSPNEQKIFDEFKGASRGFAHANIQAETLRHFPRLFLEAISFGLLAFLITYLVYMHQRDITNALPTLSMFVLALYRLMPSVNRIMTSYNQIMFYHKSLEIIHSELMYPAEELQSEKIDFQQSIQFSNLSFEYEEDKPVLIDINLTIRKGEKIAFVGESGSGKSTLVDIIIGLYHPQEGNILVDGVELNGANIKDWRSKVGYIPQDVYLFDGTVAENIVFDGEYDEEKVIDALKKANIYDFLLTKEGIATKVGEGGVMLSGGQKQRIAIARALYNNPEILVLDEATSALDTDTEETIMDEIYSLSDNKTLIIIAHRLSTTKQCDKMYKINRGNLLKVSDK